jgi:hypothetical protein
MRFFIFFDGGSGWCMTVLCSKSVFLRPGFAEYNRHDAGLIYIHPFDAAGRYCAFYQGAPSIIAPSFILPGILPPCLKEWAQQAAPLHELS